MPFDSIYTFTNARDEVVYRMGKRTEMNPAFESRVTRWLDTAQSMFANALIDVPDLEETIESFPLVPDVSEYDLRTTTPALANIVGIRHIINNKTQYLLRRFPFVEYRQLVNQANADPVRWTRRGHLLVVDPKPTTAQTLTIEYRRRPYTGVLEVDNHWQDTVIDIAVYHGWRALQDYSKAQEVFTGLPQLAQLLLNMPLDQYQWEAQFDPDFGIHEHNSGLYV